MHHITKLQNILQQHFRCNKARIRLISSFIVSLIRVKTIKLTDISLDINHRVKYCSNYRRIQRFFSEFVMDYDVISRFVITQLPKDKKYILTLDRTNWQFGKKDINILMLGIVYRDTSIPLYWKLLNKRGNSSIEERKELVEKAINLLGLRRIKSLVADREFASAKWFKYLIESKLEFHIRIRKDAVITKYKSPIKTVRSLFKYNKAYSYIVLPDKKMVYNNELYISGRRTNKGEYFILASNNNPGDALKDYKQRWTIENLFGYLKTKGFDFEKTHMTDPIKIKKLIALLTIAFLWSYLVGVWIDDSIKIKLKINGRKEISIFRKGLDYLRSVIFDLNLKSKEFNFLTKFLSCT